MEIIDITDEYITKILEKDNLTDYKKSYPFLFNHYFNYWANELKFKPLLDKKQVYERKELVKKQLPFIEKKFKQKKLSLKNIKIVFFVGCNTSNGHAFLENRTPVVWIPIETYKTNFDARVFITHEIAHALHYSKTPDFYFKNHNEKGDISTSLIVEGVATYISKTVLGISDSESLWAKYINKKTLENWMTLCKKHEQKLIEHALKHFYESKENFPFFIVGNLKDPIISRGGYYVGLKVIEYIMKKGGLNLNSLLEIKKPKLEELTLEFLKQNKP